MLFNLLHSQLLLSFLGIALAGELAIGNPLLDRVKKEYGQAAIQRLESWQQMISQSRNLTDINKLKAVNRFFNQMRFISDQKHWGQEDFWATPVEFMASGGGDCEDFSIAKYFTLRELGIDDSKMRITYVRALKLNQAHMVLSFFSKPDKEPLILDNLIDEIKPASQRKDLKPVYNFNGDGLWVSRQQGKGVRVGNSSRIKLWTNLRKRLEQSAGQEKPVKTKRILP